MGNKTNPIGMRLQVNRTWDSRWYADTKDYGNLLLEDIAMREFIAKECKQAGVARVIIERPHKKCRVTIHTARPGVIIGKKGADIETLRKKLAAKTDSELHLNIVEVRKPELDAQLVGESISQQLERRVSPLIWLMEPMGLFQALPQRLLQCYFLSMAAPLRAC